MTIISCRNMYYIVQGVRRVSTSTIRSESPNFSLEKICSTHAFWGVIQCGLVTHSAVGQRGYSNHVVETLSTFFILL